MAEITGDQSNNSLTGNEQENDTINGLEGDDILLGLSGDDTLNGGEGNDTLDGGLGDDTLNGGNGDDTYRINRDLSGVNTINDAAGNDTLEIYATDGTLFQVALAAPAERLIGIERDGANVLVDIGADGIADDLIVEDFFASADSNDPGAGFIDTFGVTSGTDVQNFLAVADPNFAPEFDQDPFTFETVDLDEEGDDAQNGDVVGTVTATDANEGDTLTFAITGGNDPDENDVDAFAIDEATGEVSIVETAELLGDSFNGQLTVTVTDQDGASDEATVSIPVDGPENDPPIAGDDTGSTDEESALTVDIANGVLANDVDPDGDDLTVSAVNGDEANVGTEITLESGALLTLNADGSYEYDPNGAFDDLNDEETAADTFTYTVADGNGGTDTADVEITVEGITPPSGTPVEVTVNFLADNNGEPGDAIEDGTITQGDNFFVEILVAADTPVGVSSFSLDIDFDQAVLDALSDFEDPESIIIEKFDFDPGRTADLNNGTITLAGGTVDANTDDDGDGVPDNVIGANGNPERFALLEFNALEATEDSTLNLEFPGINADGDPLGGTLGDGTAIDSDDVNLSLQDANFNIIVGGGEENVPPEFDQDSFTFETVDLDGEGDDDAQNGDVVGTVTATDANEGDTLTFAITGGNDPDGDDVDAFAIDEASGEVTIVDTAELLGDSFNGELTVTVTDQDDASDDATVVIPVNGPENNPPAAADDSNSTAEDTVLTVEAAGVLANDTDPEGDALTVSAVNGGEDNVGTEITLDSGALLTLNADGSYEYDPNGAFDELNDEETDTDTFTYTVSDGNSTDTADVEITIEGVTDGVQETTVNVTTNFLTNNNGEPGDAIEDGTITQGDNFFVEILVAADTPVGVSTFSLNIDFEQAVLNAISDFETPESIIIEKFDFGPVRTADLNNGTITLAGGTADATTDNDGDGVPDNVIGADNNPERFALLEFNALEATTDDSTLDLEFPGIDADGNPLGGSLGDGTSLTSDNVNLSLQDANFNIIVGGGEENVAPEFDQDQFTFETVDLDGEGDDDAQNGDAVGTVTATDDNEGDTLTFEITGGNDPDENGTNAFAIDEATGEVSIVETAELLGDSFNGELTVTVTDQDGASDEATVVIPVNSPENDPPIAADDSNSTAEDTVLTVEAAGVLANDTDPEGDALTVSAVNGGEDNVGTEITLDSGALLTLNADGSYDYDPNGAFDGLNDGETDTDTFTYTVSDGNSTDTADVEITIEGVTDDVGENQPPVVGVGNFEVREFAANGTEVGQLDISDPDGDVLTVSLSDASQVRLINTFTGGTTEDPDVDDDGDLPFAINNEGVITVNDTDDLGPLFDVVSFGPFFAFTRTVPSFDLTVEVSDGEATTIGAANIDVNFGRPAFGFGDPHVTTFDRNSFGFQVVGEFTLVESTDENNPLNIQARTAPATQENGELSDRLSNYTAIATEIDGNTVAIYAGEENPVFVNGEAQADIPVDGLEVGDDGGRIVNLGNGFFNISLGGEAQERIVVQVFENRIDPRFFLSEERNGNITGVMGNKDGDPSNDIVDSNGDVIENATFDQINDEFANAFRVTEADNSLLLRDGEDIGAINEPDFPAEEVTLASLEADLGEQAFNDIVAQVEEAGVPEGFLRTSAIIDFATTGDQSFIGSALNVAGGNATPEVTNSVFNIEEDLGDGEVVGTVPIRDGDDGLDNLEVSISAGNEDVDGDGELPFAIDGQGQITINDSGDLEAGEGTAFSLSVTATDPLGATATGSVTIVENNPDVDQPPSVAANVNDIRENSAEGTIVGRAVAVDAEGDDFTFGLEGELDPNGNGTDAFTIAEDGLITVADSGDLDFETTPSFEFDVTATQTNDDTIIGTSTVTVNLIDVEPEDGGPIEFDLDVDGSGAANGSVDGLNILRVLFNLGPETMDNSQAPEGVNQQNIFDNIQVGLEGDNPPLDVDGSEAANGSVDGLNILRVLFNLGPETMDVSQAPEGVGQQNIFDNVENLIPGAEA